MSIETELKSNQCDFFFSAEWHKDNFSFSLFKPGAWDWKQRCIIKRNYLTVFLFFKVRRRMALRDTEELRSPGSIPSHNWQPCYVQCPKYKWPLIVLTSFSKPWRAWVSFRNDVLIHHSHLPPQKMLTIYGMPSTYLVCADNRFQVSVLYNTSLTLTLTA